MANVETKHGIAFCCLLALLSTAPLSAQQGTHVSARFAAVKGVVMAAPGGSAEKQVHKGDSIRSGTVITCGAESGASLKPLSNLHVIIYPDTKVRFDGADAHGDGGGSVMCSILAGKALFHIDQKSSDSPTAPGAKETQPPVKVTVVTDEGTIVNTMGGKPEAGNDAQQTEGTTKQITTATWTVQHDEGRTVVAVGEGMSRVTIGKGAAAGGGQVGGQVKVPQGSVVWLFNRDGKIEADLVDTNTGKVTNLTGGQTSGGSDLVQQSKQQLVTPSSSGTTSTFGTTTNTTGTGTTLPPTNTSSNPDLSTPQKPLPVVSADTP